MMRRGLLLLPCIAAVMFAFAACGDDDNNGTQNLPGSDGGVDSSSNNDGANPATGDGSVPGYDDGPVDPDMAARAAVALNSCLDDFEADSTIEQMYGRRRAKGEDYRAMVKCIDAAKGGCAAVVKCTGYTVDLTGPCERRCEGNVLIGCDDEAKFSGDCTAVGKICFSSPAGEAACVFEDAPTCDPSSTETRRGCAPDGRPTNCQSNGRVSHGPNCTELGMTCDVDHCKGSGAATCQSTSGGGSQIVFEGKACDGAKLSACVGNAIHSFDCASNIVGASCQTRPTGGGQSGTEPIFYCGLGTACEPGDPAQATCDGDNVVVCNGGRIDKVDCKSLGFTGCVSTQQYAICYPSFKADAFARFDAGL